MVPLRDICLHEIFSFQFILFAIRRTRERPKEKKNTKSYYLDSHGEEAQKKPAGL